VKNYGCSLHYELRAPVSLSQVAHANRKVRQGAEAALASEGVETEYGVVVDVIFPRPQRKESVLD